MPTLPPQVAPGPNDCLPAGAKPPEKNTWPCCPPTREGEYGDLFGVASKIGQKVCIAPSYSTVNITPYNFSPQYRVVDGGQSICGGDRQLSQQQADGTYCCDSWGGTCWKRCNRYGAECGPGDGAPAAQMCPPVAGLDPIGWQYTAGIGGAIRASSTGVKVKCTYRGVASDPFAQDISTTFNGSADLDKLRTDFCSGKKFGDLLKHTGCQTHYSGKGILDAEYVKRIHMENEQNWVDNKDMREKILSISAGSGPSKKDAGQMITDYCLKYHADNWPDNDTMRTFINNMYSTTQGNQTDAYLKTTASTLIDAFCASHKTSERCACKNAINQGINGCVANSSVPGCAELKSFSDNLTGAPDAFNSLVGSIRQSAKPICLSSACRTAATDPAGKYLRTADDVTLTCPDNINLCLSSVKVGGNISANAKIVQDCSIAVNYTGPNPLAKPPSGGLAVSGGAQSITDSTGTKVTATPATTTQGGAPAGTPGGAPAGTKLPITNPAIANVLNTSTKQYAAIGGFAFLILCCCCLMVLLLMGGGGSSGPSGPSASNMALARLMTAGA